MTLLEVNITGFEVVSHGQTVRVKYAALIAESIGRCVMTTPNAREEL